MKHQTYFVSLLFIALSIPSWSSAQSIEWKLSDSSQFKGTLLAYDQKSKSLEFNTPNGLKKLGVIELAPEFSKLAERVASTLRTDEPKDVVVTKTGTIYVGDVSMTTTNVIIAIGKSKKRIPHKHVKSKFEGGKLLQNYKKAIDKVDLGDAENVLKLFKLGKSYGLESEATRLVLLSNHVQKTAAESNAKNLDQLATWCEKTGLNQEAKEHQRQSTVAAFPDRLKACANPQDYASLAWTCQSQDLPELAAKAKSRLTPEDLKKDVVRNLLDPLWSFSIKECKQCGIIYEKFVDGEVKLKKKSGEYFVVVVLRVTANRKAKQKSTEQLARLNKNYANMSDELLAVLTPTILKDDKYKDERFPVFFSPSIRLEDSTAVYPPKMTTALNGFGLTHLGKNIMFKSAISKEVLGFTRIGIYTAAVCTPEKPFHVTIAYAVPTSSEALKLRFDEFPPIPLRPEPYHQARLDFGRINPLGLK